MSNELKKILIVLLGMVVALVTDFHSFLKSWEKDQTLKYDWKLAIGRATWGVLAGGGGALVVGE